MGNATSLPTDIDPSESLVQPGRQVLDGQLPPELAGTLIKVGTRVHGGYYTDIFQGIWTQLDGSAKTVAIRCIRPEMVGHNELRMRIRIEAAIWQEINHPNILQFIGYQVVEGIPWLVAPWCKHHDLSRYIASNSGIKDAEKLKLLCDAARGLKHLHSLIPSIVHGDIKPESVLVKDDLEAVLCDFGVSRVVLRVWAGTGFMASDIGAGGNAAYQAKELLEGGPPTAPGDVYAFGGLILAVMSGKAPFWKKTNDSARIHAVWIGEMPSPNNHPLLPEADLLWNLLRRCWNGDPTARPDMDFVLQKLESDEESVVQPGRRVYMSELPPPISWVLKKIGEPIAKGAYSEVYQGRLFLPGTNPKDVVIKCLKPFEHSGTERFRTRIKRETVIWKMATHRNILPFIGYQIVDGTPMLVSPWCKNGDLATYVKCHPELKRNEKLQLLCNAASGLAFLHSRDPPIFHGDIKPQNVLVQDNLEAVLCDFGISKVILGAGERSGLTTLGEPSGTSGYQAKELLLEASSTSAVDVYAFGGLVLATMSGKPPFWKLPHLQAIAAIIHDQEPDPDYHNELPKTDPLWDLMRECWRVEPFSRPSMLVVLERLEAEM